MRAAAPGLNHVSQPSHGTARVVTRGRGTRRVEAYLDTRRPLNRRVYATLCGPFASLDRPGQSSPSRENPATCGCPRAARLRSRDSFTLEKTWMPRDLLDDKRLACVFVERRDYVHRQTRCTPGSPHVAPPAPSAAYL